VVRAVVGSSHGNFKRVRELVEARPELSKASWDWGFGDWETALGAAAHTGNYDIARFLIEHGARPDIFTFAMMGHVDTVKAMVAALPGIQRTLGPHGITLLQHARISGDRAVAVVKYLESLGDADGAIVSEPLSEELKKACLGQYDYGGGADHALIIGESRNGMLSLKHGPKGTGRRLRHRGDLAFSPAGAPAVRIKMTVEAGRCTRVTVHDGTVLTAVRI
jgi:hypothetical protein